jgi:transposase-like protein
MQAHLEELYGVDVSPDLISTVTDAVLEEVTEWQQRPLLPLYPVIFFDALRVRIRDEGTVRAKAVYLALGIVPDGTKDVLGLWIEQTEGPKFWLRVMTELKRRGVEDVLVVEVDGLKGFPEAITTVFPPGGGPDLHRAPAALLAGLRDLATSEGGGGGPEGDLPSAHGGGRPSGAGSLCRARLGPAVPPIAPAWRRHWEQVIPLFAHPPEIRRMLYTTNAIESLHLRLRKALKIRGHCPTDEAASQLIYLVLRNITRRWRHPRDVHEHTLHPGANIGAHPSA